MRGSCVAVVVADTMSDSSWVAFKGVIGCKIHFYMLFEIKCVLAVWGSGVLEAMAGLGAVLFSLLLLPKCQILAFGNISIQNRDSSIYKKKYNCCKTLHSN